MICVSFSKFQMLTKLLDDDEDDDDLFNLYATQLPVILGSLQLLKHF